MLTGRLPFAGKSAQAMMLAISTQPVPRIRDVRSDMPEVPASIVDRALEKDVARRTLSAADIASQIADWQARSSAAAAVSAAVSGATPARWWKAVAAVAIAGAVLTGASFVRQNERTRWAREEALPEIERLVKAAAQRPLRFLLSRR